LDKAVCVIKEPLNYLRCFFELDYKEMAFCLI
jgi:hypothetical protein